MDGQTRGFAGLKWCRQARREEEPCRCSISLLDQEGVPFFPSELNQYVCLPEFRDPNLSPVDLEPDSTVISLRRRLMRKPKGLVPNLVTMLKLVVNRLHYYYKLHPLAVFLISLSVGLGILIFLSVYEHGFRKMSYERKPSLSSGSCPFASLRNLVMVDGHSIYISTSCGKADKEGSWFLEPYQKHPGQAVSFLTHIREGVEITAKDERALLSFRGGETRKDDGPRVKLRVTGLSPS